MAFRFTEKPTSRRTSFDPPSAEYEYVAAGEADNTLVEAYALAMTSTMVTSAAGVLHRNNITLDPVGADFFNVTVSYGKRETAAGSYRFSFDTTGGTVHITASKETVGSFPAGAPDCKQLIGVHGDDVEGCDIVIPALRFTITFKHPLGFVSLARMKQIARNTGRTNDRQWMGFAAGEVLFMGARGDEGSDTETEVAYEFVASENASGLTIGDVTDIVKAGHDVAWIAYADAVDGGKPVKEPEFVYVERVYDSADFATVLGFDA